MRRITSILLVLLLCAGLILPTYAADGVLIGRISTFMNTHKLDESNFAMSYFNLSTGEKYQYNAQTFFPVGRVSTLPLHLYYCLQEYNGAFLPTKNDPNYNDPDYEYTIDGMTLAKCRTESILNANEGVEKAMRQLINQYKTVINEKFGYIKTDDLPEEYYLEDIFSTEFLMNCMRVMESSTATYGTLSQLYDLAQTADGYNSGNCTYKIIQIRGEEDGKVCAIAKVFAPQPYLIACVISEAAGGDAVLSDLNLLLCDYIESLNTGSTSQGVQVNIDRSDSSYLITNASPNETPVLKWIGYALTAALAMTLVYYLVFLLVRRLRKKDE